MFEDILKKINELSIKISEINYKSLISGDVSQSNYCRGYYDALSNIEAYIYELDRSYDEWIG